MTEDDPKPARPVSEATKARREQRARDQQKRSKSFRYLLYGVYVLLAVLIGLAVIDRLYSWDVEDHSTEYFGKEDFVGQHTAEPVLYEQIPPVGGPHARVPQACGFYGQYVHNENAVHSLEHGAIWITYDPGIDGDDLDRLRELATQPYVLVSPYPGLASRIVVSSWGHQMNLDDVDEKKIDSFRRKYGNTRDFTPEFGASCGINFTEVTDIEPQQQPYVSGEIDGPPLGGVPNPEVTSPGTPGATPFATPAVR